MDHDTMKTIREKINAGYVKNQSKLLENLERVFRENDSLELRGLFAQHVFVKSEKEDQKSILSMYNELYDKVELEAEFENDYEKWVEDEVLMFQVY